MSIWNIPIVLALDKQVYDGFMNLLDWVEEVLLGENISHLTNFIIVICFQVFLASLFDEIANMYFFGIPIINIKLQRAHLLLLLRFDDLGSNLWLKMKGVLHSLLNNLITFRGFRFYRLTYWLLTWFNPSIIRLSIIYDLFHLCSLSLQMNFPLDSIELLILDAMLPVF